MYWTGIIFTLLCLGTINGRNLHETNNEIINDSEEISPGKEFNDFNRDPMRHNRRSRRYGQYYDNSPFYHSRRNYNRNQDELLSHIVTLLDEIAFYNRQPPPPPPPPQIIYVPYPIYVPQYNPMCKCGQPSTPSTNITTKWPEMDDDNQNWGLAPGNQWFDLENDGSRPVNLEPVEPPHPNVKPPPSVEQEIEQDGMDSPSQSQKNPGLCRAAILVCCGYSNDNQRKECFSKYNCKKTYSIKNSCHPLMIQNVIDQFKDVYAPS